MKSIHLHRWWPYRNHLQLAILYGSQLKMLIDQKKRSLIDNRSVEATNQDVWMLNYYLQGNEGVFRALIEQNQIGQPYLLAGKIIPILEDCQDAPCSV